MNNMLVRRFPETTERLEFEADFLLQDIEIALLHEQPDEVSRLLAGLTTRELKWFRHFARELFNDRQRTLEAVEAYCQQVKIHQ
jgi:hypothetical protein